MTKLPNEKKLTNTTSKRIELWKERFLVSLRAVPNITTACAAAGVSRQSAYRTRAEDSVFAEKWTDALDKSIDALEARAFEIAMEGDTNLLQFILRAHRPETYKETQRHEVGLVGGVIFLPQKAEGAE